MKKELEDTFYADYPKLANDVYIAVNDGWYDILRDMFAEVQAELDKQTEPDNADEYAHFSQIKEKFGDLRVYMNGNVPSEVYDIISKYERLSSKVCEDCGTRGTKTKDCSWITTLCVSCKAKHDRK